MTVSCHNNLPWPILFWGSYISQNVPGLPEGTLHPSKEIHLGYCRLSLEYFIWALFRERLWFGIRPWGFLNPSNWTSTCFGVQSAFQYQTLKLGFCYRFFSLISVPPSQEPILQIMMRELGPGVSIIWNMFSQLSTVNQVLSCGFFLWHFSLSKGSLKYLHLATTEMVPECHIDLWNIGNCKFSNKL